jgi:hypothetical protein
MRRQLFSVVAITLAVSGLFVSTARAQDGGVTWSSACFAGDGVVDLTLHNFGTASLEYTVVGPVSGTQETITVEPGLARAVSFEGIPDGGFTVAITAGGSDLSVAGSVKCDPIVCPPGSTKVIEVVDGVDTEVCVAVQPATTAPPQNTAPGTTIRQPNVANNPSLGVRQNGTATALPATGTNGNVAFAASVFMLLGVLAVRAARRPAAQ